MSSETILSLWTSSPAQRSSKSFISILLPFLIGRRFTRGDKDFAARAIHKRGLQYAVLKGKTFTLKNGVQILQCAIKLIPA